MRKVFAAAVLAATTLASSVLVTAPADAFSLQGSGSSSAGSSGAAGGGSGTNYTDPDEKLLQGSLGGLQAQPDAGQGVHFGDKHNGLTFQATPAPGVTGAARFWSMETNPWQ